MPISLIIDILKTMKTGGTIILPLFFGFASVYATAEEGKRRPNIVFILTDDHNYEFLGCNGNNIIKTPELDRLANEGIRFTNAHMTSS